MPETDAGAPGNETEASPGLLHHVRRGLRGVRVPEFAGHAARLGSHGWRRVSTAVSAVDSGGRISRPVGALWGRVARRIPNTGGLTSGTPEGRRNRRLAFDFAVVAAALAILLIFHHQFRNPHHPRIANALAATDSVEATAPDHSDPADHHHRRRAHQPAQPVGGPDAHALDAHPSEPIALADPHRDAPVHQEPDPHSHVDGGADFGNHPDAGHRVDHPVLPPAEVEAKTTPRGLPPNDSKPTADAALDSLLSAPVAGGPPHGNAAAPIGQSEPLPPREFEKPTHPHGAAEPLLVDNREPGDSGPPPKHEYIKKSADLGVPLPDDFAAPEPAKTHDEHHHEPKDHGPKDSGPKEVVKDDFSMPAPAAAVPPPSDALPRHDDAPHHPHHQDDHSPADHLPSDHPPAGDPLLDVGPNLDNPPKGAPAGPPPKVVEKIEVSKHDHPDDGLPVLSVPSPHQHDEHPHEHDSKLAGDGPKSDGPKIDDLGPPPRTASASDTSLAGPPDGGKALPKPAGDASLDDLLNSKVPTSPSAAPAKPSAPAAPPTAPVAGPKDDPFHTDVPPRVVDAPAHAAPPPKQAEPAVEIAAPLPKPHSGPPQVAVEEDSPPSVAVAHHQLEKDETGALRRYRIVVSNKGKKAVKTFEVDEAVLAEHTVRLTDPPAETHDQELHWTLHDLAPGEDRTILVTLAPPPAPPEHAAVPRPAIAEPVVPAPLATEPIPPAAPHVAIKTDSPQLKLELITPVEVHAGETCRIGFRATNLGGKTSDLRLNLDLPQQLRYARGQQLQYKIGELGDHEAREDYLTATASGTGQVELRAELLQSGHSIATAKGSCRIAPAGAPRGGIQQTGAWAPAAPVRTANGSDCLCYP